VQPASSKAVKSRLPPVNVVFLNLDIFMREVRCRKHASRRDSYPSSLRRSERNMYHSEVPAVTPSKRKENHDFLPLVANREITRRAVDTVAVSLVAMVATDPSLFQCSLVR